MSAHNYFRDFAYGDIGVVHWLLIAVRFSTTGVPLAQMVEQRIAAYPCMTITQVALLRRIARMD